MLLMYWLNYHSSRLVMSKCKMLHLIQSKYYMFVMYLDKLMTYPILSQVVMVKQQD